MNEILDLTKHFKIYVMRFEDRPEFYIGRTTLKKLDCYWSGSKKWKRFCEGKNVIKELIASFDSEEDQVALELWYNHEVYQNELNCWSRKTLSIMISESSKKIARKRIEEGTFHFLGGDVQREAARKQVENGTHNFLGGDVQRESNRKRILDGTHNLLGCESNRKRIENGTHNFKIKKTCPHCQKTCSMALFARWHGDRCKHKGIQLC